MAVTPVCFCVTLLADYTADVEQARTHSPGCFLRASSRRPFEEDRSVAAKRELHVANLIPQRANLCESHTCSGTLEHTSALSFCEHIGLSGRNFTKCWIETYGLLKNHMVLHYIWWESLFDLTRSHSYIAECCRWQCAFMLGSCLLFRFRFWIFNRW